MTISLWWQPTVEGAAGRRHRTQHAQGMTPEQIAETVTLGGTPRWGDCANQPRLWGNQRLATGGLASVRGLVDAEGSLGEGHRRHVGCTR
jgi:hypothetical protein